MKITTKELALLHAIAESPFKSGRFWMDLGHAVGVLASLDRKFLIGARYSYFESTIPSRSWYITADGRAILRQERNRK